MRTEQRLQLAVQRAATATFALEERIGRGTRGRGSEQARGGSARFGRSHRRFGDVRAGNVGIPGKETDVPAKEMGGKAKEIGIRVEEIDSNATAEGSRGKNLNSTVAAGSVTTNTLCIRVAAEGIPARNLNATASAA